LRFRARGMATTPRGGASTTGSAVWLSPAEWCEPDLVVLGWACQRFLSAPVWYSFMVADVVGVWFIAALLLRQREQDKEVRRRREALPRSCRVRRDWAAIAAAVRLASMSAAMPERRGCVAVSRPLARWEECWRRVSEARAARKDYFRRVDFNLTALMTRACGPLMMIVVVALVSFELHAFFDSLSWFHFAPGMEAWLRCISKALPLRIFFDYFRTVFTDPGLPIASVENGSTSSDTHVELLEMGQGAQKRRCKTCGGPKPIRSHHCRVCRRCVLKMDHHCPFVNNCVGLRNYLYFCFFLFDLVVACAVILGVMAPQMPEVLFETQPVTTAHRVRIIVAFMVALFAECSLAPFFVFHLQLILMNETTLEFLTKRSRRLRRRAAAEGDSLENDYSRGVMENFTEVCGAPPAVLQRHFTTVFELLVPSYVTKLAKRNA